MKQKRIEELAYEAYEGRDEDGVRITDIEDAIRKALSEEAQRAEAAPLEPDVETILRGFDEGIFVRDIAHDSESGWAVRLLPFLGALGRLSNRRSPMNPKP